MKKQEKRPKSAKATRAAATVAKPEPADTPRKPIKILSPFVRFGCYVSASFRELRLMRFPNRKAAWKMTLAVIVYALIFFIFIALLDAFWGMVFQRLIG
jgi:preprotein translocase SecE subunit